ncbi:MAG: Trk system potassium transporter TrkA [Nitrospirota bacterium]|nr:MAG: Trk system potassium transporter TrkA [Nitrospirota bacterium]
MKVIVVGAGEVGYHVAKFLAQEKVDVTIIDSNKESLRKVSEELDVAVLEGHGGAPSVYEEAAAEGADILLAVTDSDETNMISCLIAKAMFNIKRRIARIRNEEYLNNSVLLNKYNLDIDPAISPELESAKAIASLIEIPLASSVEDFEDGAIKVVGYKVTASSPLVEKKLEDIRSTYEGRFLVGIVQRDHEIIIPSGRDKLIENDIVYFPVVKDEIEKSLAFVSGEKIKPVKNVMIAGGGRIGYNVAKLLENSDLNIKIIEHEAERCKFLSKSLENVVVLHGDGSDRSLLDEENIRDMDVFAAISNNEELNIMSSLLAKRMGAKKVITIVNRTDYLTVAHGLGIESVLSPRIITASSILRYVRIGEVLSLTKIVEDKAEIMEAGVKVGAKIGGSKLKDAAMPKDSLIGAIIRGEEAIIPSGEDRIEEGDRIIVFATGESIKDVEKII